VEDGADALYCVFFIPSGGGVRLRGAFSKIISPPLFFSMSEASFAGRGV
jgi:hypothetical protein